MKALGLITISAGILTLFSSFLPLAEINDYQLFVSIEHLGSVLNILYIIPIGVIVLGILTINSSLKKPRAWLVVSGVLGILLSILGGGAAINNLNIMGSRFGAAEGDMASVALGTYFMLASYVIITIAPFTPLYRRSPTI